jgi:tRNA (mo5U34)-methyltransferase
MDTAELRQRAAEIDWWHTMDLGHGITTQGRGRTTKSLPRLHLPDRLDGQTVLDIGAWDGAFSFEAERRGATRVVSADIPRQDRRGFHLAREALSSSVEEVCINVHDLDPEHIGTFDLVLFLGVLYHLRDPFGALQRVAAGTRGLLVIETAGDMLDVSRPAAAFYPGDELEHGDTNWWGFNRGALLGILRAVGFRDVRIAHCPSRPRRFARAVRDRFTRQEPFVRGCSRGRVVVHARR